MKKWFLLVYIGIFCLLILIVVNNKTGRTESTLEEIKQTVSSSPSLSPVTCPSPPDTFLLRSSCPYTSAIIDGECRVICPLPDVATQTKFCKKDTDCHCDSYLQSHTKEKATCRCTNNACAAVIDKAETSNWP